MKIQHKRSAALDGGAAKEPTAAQTEFGELCVNFNSNDPALFIKDNADNIVRVGGDLSQYQKIDEVPNAVFVCPPSEIDTQSPPAQREEGALWWNTEEGILYVWYEDPDSSQWVISVPQGGSGGEIPPGTTVGITPPDPAVSGQLWWNSDQVENGGGRLYVYYENAWIDTSVPGGKGSYLSEAEAEGLFLSKTEDDTAAGKITFEAGIDVTGASSFEVSDTNPGISQTFNDCPYGTIQYFKPTGATRTEQMSSYVRIMHDDGGDKDLDTSKLACFYGQIRETTPFRFTTDATVSCYDNIHYTDNIKAEAGKTVTVSGYRSNVPLSTEAGVDNFNFYCAGSAPNYFSGKILTVASKSHTPIGAAGAYLFSTTASSSGSSGAWQVMSLNGGSNTTRVGITFSAKSDTESATAATLVGSISTRGTSGTRYASADGTPFTIPANAENVSNATALTFNASNLVKLLQPKQFELGGRLQLGFLAPDIEPHVPLAVEENVDAEAGTSEKEYNPLALIPVLTKALQEVIAKNEDLEARLAALEGA